MALSEPAPSAMQGPGDAATCSNPLKGEDRTCSAIVDICGETVQLLMVADGHGGEEVAELCAQHAFNYLVKEATDTGNGSAASLEKALFRTFERLHTSARALSPVAGPLRGGKRGLALLAWPS